MPAASENPAVAPLPTEASRGRRLRRLAALFAAGVFLVLLAFAPLDLRIMGYSGDEIEASFHLLEWLRGERPPGPAAGLLQPHGIVTLHGIFEPAFKLPFVALGKTFEPLLPDSPRFAERLVAFLPLLQTALIGGILFLWIARLTGKPRWGVALAGGGVFCTYLWPYAYMGLEPSQALALLVTAYLALAADPGAAAPAGATAPGTSPGTSPGTATRRARVVAFVVCAALTIAIKKTGVLMLPAVGFLIHEFFSRRARCAGRKPSSVWGAVAATLAIVVAVAALNRHLGASFFPPGADAAFLRRFIEKNPVRLVANALMLLFSGNKGLIVYAPLAMLGLYVTPLSFRRQRSLTIFTLLLLAGILAAYTVIGVPAEETWGPRYLYPAVSPLLLCLAAAWGAERVGAARRVTLSVVLLAGFFVSALGTLFFYGRPFELALRSNQATLEALWGDPVWSPVEMQLRLLGIWLGPPGASAEWSPKHEWWYTRPLRLPPVEAFDLRPYAVPQPLLLLEATRARPALFGGLAGSLAGGLALLALAWRRAGRIHRIPAAPSQETAGTFLPPGT
ncbi:MAG: hypothetical protein ABI639_13900 [Thermoanaerobaculia bacterium]